MSRKIKFSGANGDREIFIFPVQLTRSRFGNVTRLIHTWYTAISDDNSYSNCAGTWYKYSAELDLVSSLIF